ncbi:Hsp20/alpha crystallin family protein [Halobacillus fulvus]|nr:Hsp20/alpha crystallin family protein [Halobacillus fulvus]
MTQFKDWKSNLDRFFSDDFWGGFEGMMKNASFPDTKGNDMWGDFEHVMKPKIPAVNMYQYDNEVLCFVNIPGMNHPKDVEVFVDQAAITLKGRIDVNQKGGHQIKSEIASGDFERTLSLPYAVRHDKIEATYKHGLLLIQLYRHIPDTNSQKPVRIRHLEDK